LLLLLLLLLPLLLKQLLLRKWRCQAINVRVSGSLRYCAKLAPVLQQLLCSPLNVDTAAVR
jgi:hypothetical protein